MHNAVGSADRSGVQIGQCEEVRQWGLEPAGHARRAPSAISADRIFDGHRWHDNAVIVIDRGMVQCIAPCDQSAGDWLTEVMPPGTLLAPGFIDWQVNGGGGVLLNDDPRQTRCARLLEHIAGTAPQAVYLL